MGGRGDGGGGSVSADVPRLDAGLAQECFRKICKSGKCGTERQMTRSLKRKGRNNRERQKRGKEEEEKVNSCKQWLWLVLV